MRVHCVTSGCDLLTALTLPSLPPSRIPMNRGGAREGVCVHRVAPGRAARAVRLLHEPAPGGEAFAGAAAHSREASAGAVAEGAFLLLPPGQICCCNGAANAAAGTAAAAATDALHLLVGTACLSPASVLQSVPRTGVQLHAAVQLVPAALAACDLSMCPSPRRSPCPALTSRCTL